MTATTATPARPDTSAQVGSAYDTWAPLADVVALFNGASATETEQLGIFQAAELAFQNARALKARTAWLTAAHPALKSKNSKSPLNASAAARELGVSRTTLLLFINAGQNSVDKKVVDLADMLGPVSDAEREAVNKFYADGIAAKRREERAAAKAAKAAAEATEESEGDDQSTVPAADGIKGADVVDGMKLAANRFKMFRGTFTPGEIAEIRAYFDRMSDAIDTAEAEVAATVEAE